VANQNADVFVLRASPKFECLATNSIGSELMNASLAVSDGDIFIRTDKHLWCIGERNGIAKMPPGRAGFGGADGAALRALISGFVQNRVPDRRRILNKEELARTIT
jgi:hypothetical protein